MKSVRSPSLFKHLQEPERLGDRDGSTKPGGSVSARDSGFDDLIDRGAVRVVSLFCSRLLSDSTMPRETQATSVTSHM